MKSMLVFFALIGLSLGQDLPFFPYDFAILYHSSNDTNKMMLATVATIIHRTLKQTPDDGANFAEIYFSGEPLEESRIDFVQSADAEDELELFMQRIMPALNTGGNESAVASKAMRFAMQHMLTEEAGARKVKDVDEAILIVTDNNLDNDSLIAAKEARDAGVSVYVVGIKTRERVLNETLFEEIAGNETNVLYVYEDQGNISAFVLTLIETFCRNQCMRKTPKEP